MAYVSLYRRFRPDTFQKLYGQEHIVKTLKKQVETGEISHAYLFTGTRGVGKTSAARIFARAINCEHPINGSPCGKCPSCLALKNENNMDVLEIDAASNNGVDEIRDLREKIKYPPVSCKYKVYIIDEVHMLSPAAFNALLKTLEEPPKHAVFILATTEAHKLPATILSRCIRFDFRLVSTEEISEHLAEILKELKRPYEPDALLAIAAFGNGSVRDALSVADLCLSYCDGEITYKGVLDVLGASDLRIVNTLADSILKGDVKSVLVIIDKAVKSGCNVSVLAKDLTTYIRNVMYMKNCGACTDVPSEQLVNIEKSGVLADNAKLLRTLEILATLEGSMRNSLQTRLLFETACVKATEAKADISVEGIITRLNALESKVESLSVNGVQISAVSADIASKAQTRPEPRKIWGQIITALSAERMYALSSACSGVRVSFDGDKFVIFAKTQLDYNTLTKEKNSELIKAQLSRFTDCGLMIKKDYQDNVNNIDELKTLADESVVRVEK